MIRALRIAGRTCWFFAELAIVVANYFFTTTFAPAKTKRLARAAWLHRSSKRHLRIFNFFAEVSGPIPKSGVLVSNHLSYLDILAIASITPAVFVSKAEVRSWPVFGWCAKLAGTIFVDRRKRMQVGEVNEEIQTALNAGALVVIFPEGTSSNGETVLPFRTSLLELAAQNHLEISVARLHYEISDGNAGNEVCYWGEHVFLPHLINLLGKKSIRAQVHFKKITETFADRKELAQKLHSEILKLKSGADSRT